MSERKCAACGSLLPDDENECQNCNQDVLEQRPKRKIGLVALIILIVATAARVLVKFLPEIKGMLRLK
jgi:predicted nucleic acid-binding Zn ribbon protein